MLTHVAAVKTQEHSLQSSWITAHSSFLASLSTQELNALGKVARPFTLRKRDLLFSAGEPAQQVYIVQQGCIKLYQLSPTGRITILWLSFPGELLGVAEAVDGSPREIFAEANVDTQLLMITKARFVEFLQSYPEAAMRAIGILSARLRTMGSSIVDLASNDVASRLVHLLLRYAASGQPAACKAVQHHGEICLNIEVTHSDLANLIGASRQTVTSTLAELRRRKLLNTIGRHIHILDVEGLRNSLIVD